MKAKVKAGLGALNCNLSTFLKYLYTAEAKALVFIKSCCLSSRWNLCFFRLMVRLNLAYLSLS